MSSTVANPPGALGWELHGAEALGVSFSQFRFTIAFFLSVIAGAAFRLFPNPRGERRGAIKSCRAAAVQLVC